MLRRKLVISQAIGAKALKRLRQNNVFQLRSGGDGAVTDFDQTFGQVQLGDLGDVVEGIVRDGGQPLGQADLGDLFSVFIPGSAINSLDVHHGAAAGDRQKAGACIEGPAQIRAAGTGGGVCPQYGCRSKTQQQRKAKD